MRVLILAAFVALASAIDPVTQNDVNHAVSSLETGLNKINVSMSADDKQKLHDGISRLANFKIEDHPEMVKALNNIKAKVPELKEKVCKIATKADDKVKPVSQKIGVGIEKGFTKLANEKFPAAIARAKTLLEETTTKAKRPDIAAKVTVQLDAAQKCMTQHLSAIAAPLGRIIQGAGARNKNTFKSLVTPFVDDVNDCESASRR